MYMDASLRIWSMECKETFFRDAAHIIGLHLKILTPVQDVSTVNLMKFTCRSQTCNFKNNCEDHSLHKSYNGGLWKNNYRSGPCNLLESRQL